jgi:phage RecT family recombinase
MTTALEARPNDSATVKAIIERRDALRAMLPAHAGDRFIDALVHHMRSHPTFQSDGMRRLMSSSTGAQSFVRAAYRAARLGVQIDMDEAYFVPMGETVSLIVSYKGLMALGRVHAGIDRYDSGEVYEGEHMLDAVGQPFEHHRDPVKQGVGTPVATYAIAYGPANPATGHRAEMGRAVIYRAEMARIQDEAIRKAGKRTDGPWHQHTASMRMKTAIRRLLQSGNFPQTPEIREALADAGMIEIPGVQRARPSILRLPAPPEDICIDPIPDDGLPVIDLNADTYTITIDQE